MARLLSTPGATPAAIDARTAVALDSSRAGSTGSASGGMARPSARSKARRVPDPRSRSTSGVVASSTGVTGRRRRAHGWPGQTVTTSRSCATTRLRNPLGGRGPSTNPRSTRPARTPSATCSLLVASNRTLVGGSPAAACCRRSANSQPGIRCSATVRLADEPQLALSVRAQRGDPGVQLGRRVEHPAAPLGQQATGLGQRRPVPAAYQQGHAHLPFDRGDPHRDGLLAHPDQTGRRAEAARLVDGGQHLAARRAPARADSASPLLRLQGWLYAYQPSLMAGPLRDRPADAAPSTHDVDDRPPPAPRTRVRRRLRHSQLVRRGHGHRHRGHRRRHPADPVHRACPPSPCCSGSWPPRSWSPSPPRPSRTGSATAAVAPVHQRPPGDGALLRRTADGPAHRRHRAPCWSAAT